MPCFVHFFLSSLWTIFTLSWDFWKGLLPGLQASSLFFQLICPSWYCCILHLVDCSHTPNSILFIGWRFLPSTNGLLTSPYCSMYLWHSDQRQTQFFWQFLSFNKLHRLGSKCSEHIFLVFSENVLPLSFLAIQILAILYALFKVSLVSKKFLIVIFH